MKLRHKEPCDECPFRRNSVRGFLGGNKTISYAAPTTGGGAVECHKTMGLPMEERSFCAGQLAVMANSFTSPHDPDTQEAVDKVGRREDCFRFGTDFYDYHRQVGEHEDFHEELLADVMEATSGRKA